jgi:gluconolactonase
VAEAWKWELLVGPATITEGPAWDGAGLVFTSIDENEIRRYDPRSGAITTIYRDTGGANGLAFGADGSLYACAGTGRTVVRYDRHGAKSIVADRFEGQRLNSPNDLAFDNQGRIWFTDPRYGDQTGRELTHDSVYRLTPTEDDALPWPIERLTSDTTRPNGLLLAPDERTLFVAQSDYSGDRQLRAYPIHLDGSLESPKVLHDFGDARGIDGMCWDSEGFIVATCGWAQSGPGPRIAIFAQDGTVIEEHRLPDGAPTNCVFGGPNLDELYVTTLEGHLYRVPNTGRTGILAAPGVRPFVGS